MNMGSRVFGLNYLWIMIKQPRPGDLLFITAAQGVPPFPRSVPPALSLDDIVHLHHRQDTK